MSDMTIEQADLLRLRAEAEAAKLLERCQQYAAEEEELVGTLVGCQTKLKRIERELEDAVEDALSAERRRKMESARLALSEAESARLRRTLEHRTMQRDNLAVQLTGEPPVQPGVCTVAYHDDIARWECTLKEGHAGDHVSAPSSRRWL
jgi:hypothetical protein